MKEEIVYDFVVDATILKVGMGFGLVSHLLCYLGQTHWWVRLAIMVEDRDKKRDHTMPFLFSPIWGKIFQISKEEEKECEKYPSKRIEIPALTSVCQKAKDGFKIPFDS